MVDRQSSIQLLLNKKKQLKSLDEQSVPTQNFKIYLYIYLFF